MLVCNYSAITSQDFDFLHNEYEVRAAPLRLLHLITPLPARAA